MSATVYVSTQTDVYLVNTTAQSGTIVLPSTQTSQGFFLTFKDSLGTFQQSTITFQTIHSSQTFEDGSQMKTFNDTYGSYTFTSDTNKWYIVGGSYMNSAVISSLNTNLINFTNASTAQIVYNSVRLQTGLDLYSQEGSLFYGTTPANAWGGAKTAFPLYPNVGNYTVVGRAEATGGTVTTTLVGPTTFTVHSFYAISGTNSPQTFSVIRPGMFEMILVGGGGNGVSVYSVAATAYGGGGGGEIIDYTFNPFYLAAGSYQVYVPSNNLSSTVFVGNTTRLVARNGGVGGQPGGASGNGLYSGGGGGGSGGGGGGGAGAGGNGSNGSAGGGGSGGPGQQIIDYNSGNQNYIYAAGGGGGGKNGTAGYGGGGTGASGALRNGTFFGGGGGGSETPGGSILNPGGTGATGAVWIRYTYFSTLNGNLTSQVSSPFPSPYLPGLWAKFYTNTGAIPDSNGPPTINGGNNWGTPITGVFTGTKWNGSNTPGPTAYIDYGNSVVAYPAGNIIYSGIYTGFIYSASNTTIQFQVYIDDGAILYFNGSVVLVDWVVGAARFVQSAVLTLSNGFNPILMRWFNTAGGGNSALYYNIGNSANFIYGAYVFCYVDSNVNQL